MKRLQAVCFITGLGCALATVPAHAVDLSASGFGTLGYAVSGQPYNYQRFIDEGGTFKRDTVLGGQLDAKFSAEWSATVQAKVAPSLNNDEDWSLTASWAFVSWRPGNDWLLRLGKQRVPMYLNSENMDVGQTYDFARLPFEMYGISPSNDFKGLYVSRTWMPDLGETTLDVFHGEADLKARAHLRDAGAIFMPVCTTITGAVLTLKQDSSTWRVGLHHTVTRRRDGQDFPSHYPLSALAPLYRVDNAMPGSEPVGYTSSIVNDVITLGGDIEMAPNWRLVSELARNIQMRTENGANTAGGYVAVLHKMGALTPYVSYARLRSMGVSVQNADNLNAAHIPGDPYGLNYTQRAASDAIMVYDQDTLALGASYALTAQSKLKAEWARTRIGNRSATVDSPPGEEVVRRQRINVLSLNYSFVF
ncbi:MAG: hypothetical protein HY019_00495 [Aquabacterium sp.]|uniref:hypothetical protein n=1 Tax=Aquabacterium sp. TaxID=1872578 RepID=UPI0025C0B747|nr:hypothetical protein [Aquabacterium sp.]MBI3380457.1 hypothetical protein [Aquabacterium sp.]